MGVGKARIRVDWGGGRQAGGQDGGKLGLGGSRTGRHLGQSLTPSPRAPQPNTGLLGSVPVILLAQKVISFTVINILMLLLEPCYMLL